VANTRPGAVLSQMRFRLPTGYDLHNAFGPPGWTMTAASFNGRWSVILRVADCAAGGSIAQGGTGRFRLEVTPPTGGQSTDTTDPLAALTPSDPCGGASGWTVTSPSSVRIPRKVLQVTGAVSPPTGAPPLAATVTWTVRNLSNATKNGVALSQVTVAPPSGWSGSCSPATRNIPSDESGTFTCAYTLSTPQSYEFSTSATGGTNASAVGASAGSIGVGAATATFALDKLAAGTGDTVTATLSVRNNTSGTITVTPPASSALQLTNLATAPGSVQPAAQSVAPGATQGFAYSLVVTGAVGSAYLAAGSASTTVGPTNVATTPQGTVGGYQVRWSPPAVVKARVSSPYGFSVAVTNGGYSPVTRVEIVNPQNGTWTGMADAGGSSGLTYAGTITSGLRYTGTLAQGATAVLNFQFASIPTVAQTTSYPFQVVVTADLGGGVTNFETYDVTAAVAVPIADVSQLTILSNGGGQVLAWTNTSSAGAPHDGVVVFRLAAPEVPSLPKDGVDYADPANRTSEVLYADRDASPISTLADAAIGAYNYRVCNHDALFVYSACNTGLNNGWLDSAEATPGGWTHQVGGGVYYLPGVFPGARVGVATNRPTIAALDAATGDRSFDPVPLTSLPSNDTPAARLADGRLVLFQADNAGYVTAIDMEAGSLYWQVFKPGEAFVAGVSGIIRQYAPSSFRAAYPTDVLILCSTAGHVLALDASTGGTLWTLDVGAGIRTPAFYDYDHRLFVATNDGGVVALDMSTSSSTTPPAALPGWQNPGGSYRLSCGRSPVAGTITCLDRSGTLSLLHPDTGAVQASLATGVDAPTSLWRVTGSAAGFLVSSASRVQRILVSGSPPTLGLGGFWAPGLTLSPPVVFSDAGTVYVAASDRRLHKLALSDVHDTGVFAEVTSQLSGVILGPVAFDVINNLFLFGASDGRIWAIKYF